MKQLGFEFLSSPPREVPVALEERTQEELVELMAAAISTLSHTGHRLRRHKINVRSYL